MYTLTAAGVQRHSDSASIPEGPVRTMETLDEDGNVVAQVEYYDNRDWAEYQEWLKVPGNVPEPYVPPVPEPPVVALTAQEIARLRALLAAQP